MIGMTKAYFYICSTIKYFKTVLSCNSNLFMLNSILLLNAEYY